MKQSVAQAIIDLVEAVADRERRGRKGLAEERVEDYGMSWPNVTFVPKSESAKRKLIDEAAEEESPSED